MRAWIVTLGCPKNLVDSEAALSVLRASGCSAARSPEDADLLVVNACSFLESSWKETVGEVERLAASRSAGQKLVVMGCLPRHRDLDLESELPQVDHFVPSGAHSELAKLVGAGPGRWLAEGATDRFVSLTGRERLTAPHLAYVKVAEGCNRKCSFCAIPLIRGRQQVRPARDIVAEVRVLAESGVCEVTLLAQDIVSWRDGRWRLPDLVAALSDTGIPWIRIFYVHPAGMDADGIEKLFAYEPVCQYLEMPVQHISSRVLREMHRGHDRQQVERLVGEARSRFPEVVIRSEVIAGFPGETEAEFEELKRFIEEIEFDSLGVFPYSPEPGTEAAGAFGSVFDIGLARDRASELSELQDAVAFGARARFIGRTLDVLIDRAVPADEVGEGGYAGRFYGQAPGVDGEVFVTGKNLGPGRFAQVRITDAGPYDLTGSVAS